MQDFAVLLLIITVIISKLCVLRKLTELTNYV